MASYCVLGGSGFIGTRLVAHLANDGHDVIVPTRDPERARHLRVQPTVRVVRADVLAPQALKPLLVGSCAAINLVGILNEPGRDGSGFRRAHVEVAQALVAACRSAAVARVIQVSALNAGAERATSHYLISKGEAEAAIRASGLDWTILQPSVVFGPGDSFLNRFANIARRVPWVFPLAMPDARFAPVHVGDVVKAVLRTLRDPTTARQTYTLCGPEIHTLRRMVELVVSTAGLQRRVIGLPRGISRVQAAIMDFVPGKPFSTDNFRSLLLDSVSADDGLRRLGIRPRSLEAGLAEALDLSGHLRTKGTFRRSAPH